MSSIHEISLCFNTLDEVALVRQLQEQIAAARRVVDEGLRADPEFRGAALLELISILGGPEERKVRLEGGYGRCECPSPRQGLCGPCREQDELRLRGAMPPGD